MKRKTKHFGICHICKEKKQLTFEHIPPKTAFNKNTRYYSVSHEEYYKSNDLLNCKHKGIIHQGGMGKSCLCKDCNSFLGSNYVKSYQKWANVGMSINYSYEFDFIIVSMKDLNPLRILKQIISIFICINEIWFTDSYPELLDFIKSTNNSNLPDKYRIYTYLNNEGKARSFPWAVTNTHGIIGEFTFPPFGYVLSIDNKNTLQNMTEITDFKNYDDNRFQTIENLLLFKHATHINIPLDYRSKKEIEEQIKRDNGEEVD